MGWSAIKEERRGGVNLKEKFIAGIRGSLKLHKVS
jgi:hypothetical protein